MEHRGPITPEQWFNALFASKAARDGRVVRRNLRDVERYVGYDHLKSELARRGFHAVENAGQVIIFCNQEPIRRVV